MPANAFSLGRDTQLVVIAPSGRVDLTHVTGFESRQMTQPIRIDRLDGTQMAAELPKGWEGSFDLERGSSTVDDFIAATEQAFYVSGQMPSSTLYQYVTEADGSISTYQYDGTVFKLAAAGAWRGDAAVRQKLEFFATRRIPRLTPAAGARMTPTQAFIAAALDEREITDATGRRLTIHRLTALDRLRLFKAVPPNLAYNERYLGQAGLAFAVTAIDGIPIPQPTNEPQIEAAVERLGNAGINAIGAALNTAEPATATAGNSAGTPT